MRSATPDSTIWPEAVARFITYLGCCPFSLSELANRLHVSEPALNLWLEQPHKMVNRTDWIVRVAQGFPELNIRWLLTGAGSMEAMAPDYDQLVAQKYQLTQELSHLKAMCQRIKEENKRHLQRLNQDPTASILPNAKQIHTLDQKVENLITIVHGLAEVLSHIASLRTNFVKEGTNKLH